MGTSRNSARSGSAGTVRGDPLNSNEIRDALFKRGLIRCNACHSQVPRKNVHFKDEPDRKRIVVQVRCTNSHCRLFNEPSEFRIPTDQFVL